MAAAATAAAARPGALGGDVVDGAPGVRVGGAARQRSPSGRRRRRRPRPDGAGGLVVDGDGRLAPVAAAGAGSGPRQSRTVWGRSHHAGGPADRGATTSWSMDDAQVVARHPLLDEDLGAVGPAPRGVELVVGGDADGDAHALLAPGRLRPPRPPRRGSRGRRRRTAWPSATGSPARARMRRVWRLSSQRLIATAVVSSEATRGSRCCARRGTAASRPPGVEHLDRHAPAQRLVGDDAGVGVEVVEPLVLADEQPLVDGVLALDREPGPARASFS